MHRFYLFLFLFVCLPLGLPAYSPSTVPDVHLSCTDCYVSNPDGILSNAAVADLNRQAVQLKQKAEVEIAIVVIASIDDYDAADFAQELFNTWGIGGAKKNTGVLLLLALDSHDIRIQTGGGLEGLLPDAVCKRIIETDMVPLLHDGKYDEGLLTGTADIVNILTAQDALEELLLDETPLHKSHNGWLTYFMLAFGALIVMMWLAFSVLNWNPQASNNVRYNHTLHLANWGWVLACIFPIPMVFYACWYRQRRKAVRYRPVCCPDCRHMMTLMSEKEEDVYLNEAEQKEETLKSVDYDVWLCKGCCNHIILPYESSKTQYSRCPRCHAKTYSLHADVVCKQATEFSAGYGEKTYLCRHCGYQKTDTYKIAKLAAAVVVGGGLGSGRSGSSFGGGSWGGGSSFGGGAGGKF